MARSYFEMDGHKVITREALARIASQGPDLPVQLALKKIENFHEAWRIAHGYGASLFPTTSPCATARGSPARRSPPGWG